ncbi:MAG: AAA family ATPase [Alphaproteobacteria bacterium]|nr:AAA family ATPase [Alphaproteobacteria bacterium]
MNLKDKQVVLYYMKNLIQGDVEPEDIDVFFHHVSRYSADLFGFSFKEITEHMKRSLSSEGKSYFLQNLVTAKIDFNEFIEDEKTVAEYQNHITSRQNIYNVDITTREFDNNFHVICDAFDLPDYCRPLLQFFVCVSKMPLLNRMVNNFAGMIQNEIMDEDNEDLLAQICKIAASDVKKAMAQNGPLFDSGILIKTFTDRGLSSMFKKLLSMQFKNPREVRNELLGAPLKTDLTAENFDYMEQDYKYMTNVLESAIKSNTSGINILLYGRPGCGKTELAKSVCAAAGACLYSTAVNSEDKDSRLSNLAQIQTVLKNDDNSVILFDEAEDVFSLMPFFKNTPSKLYINRRLETNKRPVIWITNKIWQMDKAYIRRFTLALNISDPDERAKTTAWQRVFDKYKVQISDTDLTKLIRKYNVPMALVDTAVKNAKMLGDVKMLEYTLDNMVNAMTGVLPSNKSKDEVEFDTQLLNTDTDLEKLATQIINKKKNNFSLCLYGVPGTGKTAFANYLGERLGMPVLKKRASDILGSYVGETEHNIAAAFSEARAQKAILVFDEADSFLQDRTRAVRSWEISSVNEMLTQMESAEYPFICTTNLMDNLDMASLRRFSFKVKYDYLKPDQVVRAFKDFFNQTISLDQVSDLTHLTPGDFSVVKKQSEFMDICDSGELIKMLAGEQKVKKTSGPKIGFQSTQFAPEIRGQNKKFIKSTQKI